MDPTLDRELKKGSAELLILATLEGRPRHGYDVAKRIADESGGAIRFNVASLYGLLYRLESRGMTPTISWGTPPIVSGCPTTLPAPPPAAAAPTRSPRPDGPRWPSSGRGGRSSPRR